MTLQVLVVHEDSGMRTALSRGLQAAEFRVAECDGIRSAERALKEQVFAAMVVSATCPDGDATAFLKELRLYARYDPMRIVMISDRSQVGDRMVTLEFGADDHVCRIPDVRYVVKRVQTLVHGSVATGATGVDDGPYRVLLVDDSHTYLDVLSQELGKSGHDTATASSGSEALRYLAVQTVDTVVLDVFMPGTSGIELCRVIKSWPALANVPVILLTGQAESVVKTKHRFAADDLIPKSAVLKVIDARIRELMGRAHVAGPMAVSRPTPETDAVSSDRLKRPELTPGRRVEKK